MYRRGPQREAVYRQAHLLDQVIESVADLYVDSLSRTDLYQLAIDGLINSLGDPYAGYFEDEAFARQNELTTGRYAGIGIRVEAHEGWITVVSPLTGSPAERAGIQAGDRIVSVDGKSVRGWTPDESTGALRGEAGTVVAVTVARPGVDQLLPFTIERAEIHVSAVRYRQRLDDGIGYVWLEIVNEESADELQAAIDSLRDEGVTRLVFDLRRNPGGLMREAVAIADFFLEEGQPVLETRARTARESQTFRASEGEAWPGLIVAVLVDEFSASAAEIIAGALQDHDRALIIGHETFGKGVYQTVFPLGEDEALKLTTGRWYTPLGRSIERDQLPGDTVGTDSSSVFITKGGRRLRGGGGIYPDVVVASSDQAELALNRVLGSRYQTFRRVVSEYAASTPAEADRPETGDGEALRSRLEEAGVSFTGAQWDSLQTVVTRQLEYLRARLAGGEGQELAARVANDSVVALAVDRLRMANSTQDLLRSAAR